MSMSEVLASQLEMTTSTWAALQKEGIKEGDIRAVDFFFDARDETNAQALGAALEDGHASSADVSNQRVGLLRRKVVWSVSGTTAPLRLSVDSLRDWVTTMVKLGAKHDAVFDGWGTQA